MASKIAGALGVLQRRVLAVVYGAQKRFYPFLTRRVHDDVVFLNYGYEEDPPMGVKLDPADETARYPIQLCHATATQAGGLSGKRVLEVGCGHGGGASYLTRTRAPASYVGFDVNAAGVEFCRRQHKVPGLQFVHGDAEDLPFPAESFDVVINVESAHCCPHFDRFLAEVSRVRCQAGRSCIPTCIALIGRLSERMQASMETAAQEFTGAFRAGGINIGCTTL